MTDGPYAQDDFEFEDVPQRHRENAAPPIRATHTITYTVIRYANPFLVCEACGVRAEGYVEAPGTSLAYVTHPCHHMGIRSTCTTWGPVDGCSCAKPCEVPQ